MSTMDSNTRAGSEPTGWTGWVVFAGVMMIIAGALWALQGLIAVIKGDLVIFGTEGALFLNVTGWGWVHMILGLLLLLCGFLVMQGNMFGRTIAVLLAIVSIIVNFIWLPVYPVWAIVIITLDVFIIYAVTVHGREMKSL
ncbi:MAG: hypothetical protein U0R28_05885 [Candidatus Nanopelagicales bacterium]